ncbi:MAG: tetratricopeptide repeat protein, partial [Desulfobacterales bacterium]|nr:tetratricopeptide repeat protein [Desulfobacterales bacterium]
PNYAEAHNNMGGALASRGKLEEAIHHFSEALRIKPDFTDARRNLETGARLKGKRD